MSNRNRMMAGLSLPGGGASSDTREMITCRNLWKVFGATSPKHIDEIIALAEGGMCKREILRRTGCVVGVADVSLSVRRGEVFCVMGLSGSGKSTLVRHINRLIEPSSGTIAIDGEDVGRLDDNGLRQLRLKKVSMVFQHMALFPHRPVWWNVAYGLHLRGVDARSRREAAIRLLKLVQLEEAADRFPKELSGGMQQRVGIARALATEPEILLMDEPFSALDPIIRNQLQSQFLELSAQVGKTTVIITHDLDEAMKLGNRVAIMRDGRLMQVGTPEEIVLRPVNAYVRRFVQDVPRMKIVTAGSIMERVGQPQGYVSGPAVRENAKLGELIPIADERRDIAVLDQNNQVVGNISLLNLLKNVSVAGEIVEIPESENNAKMEE